MSRSPASALELKRTFLPIPDPSSGIDAEAMLRVAVVLNRGEDWDTLLAHRYVVVLGEAGTGKTTEFMLRARSLAEQERFSFFVEISELASQGLVAAIDVDDEARLEQWRISQADSIFFLDSLDEAKLRSRTLWQALRNLRRELKNDWSRVRLVVSCRASDWMAEADRETLRSVAIDESSKVHVVQLAPLEPSQVEQLARFAGVTDVDDFMTAIADNHAQVFIERPLDVQWLGAYWVRHRRIGSLRELIADNVREKLKERAGRPTTLPLTKAEAGVQSLAGVALINGSRAFVVPDGSIDAQHATEAINPHDFLPDWSSADIGELLRRPVFDEATYGRVRLHHRVVQEFLAAQWLANLISGGLRHAKVEELFFRGEDGEKVIPSPLGPVAAWLSIWDEQLCRTLITEAPWLLIGHGDPSGFSDEQRRRILQEYASSYAGRARRFESFDHASLQRFSAPALSDQIKALLAAPDTPEELISTLLEIVEYGRLSACADTCLTLALDQTRSGEVRVSAIRAAAATGSNDHREALMTLLETTSEWEQDVAGAFVRALYPDALGVQGLLRLLASAKPKRRNLTTSLQVVLEHEVSKVGRVELRLELLRSLLEVIWVFDPVAKSHKVPASQQWLLPMVARLLSSILDELAGQIAHIEEVTSALDIFRWCNKHGLRIWHGLDDAKEAVARHSEVRRTLFWQQVEEHKASKRTTPTHYFDLQYRYGIFDLTAEDHTWLAEDARSKPHVQERLLAFDALSRNPAPGVDQAKHLEVLRAVAEGIPELGVRLERMLNPVLRSFPQSQTWDLMHRARALAKERRKAHERASLERCIDQIRDGSHFGALQHLYFSADRSQMASGGAVIESLESQFGVEIARAAVAGWRAFWRTFDPPMPHKRETGRAIPNGVLVGLVGLNLDFADGLKPCSLDRDAARTAARYAAWELSSFPAWLAGLTESHREVVTATLRPAVFAELGQPKDHNPVGHVLAKLARSAEPIRGALAPHVAEWLCVHEPPTVSALSDALDVLIGQGIMLPREWAALSREKCRRFLKDPERFATWWDGFVSLDPTNAAEFLVEAVGDSDRETGDLLMLQVCHTIHERSRTYAPRPFAARHEPAVLKQLLPLVYEHIRPEDDLEHEGVFSPGPRDHAQWVRNQMVSWLVETPGPESVEALRGLAEHPRLITFRDWLLHCADQRLLSDAGSIEPNVVSALTQLCRSHGTEAHKNLGALGDDGSVVRILFLGANPPDSNGQTLALDEEVRGIEQTLRAARLRDSFELKSRWAVRPSDLQQALLDEEPTIVHFSGHGSGATGLVFHSEVAGDHSLVTGTALRSTFQALSDKVRVIVLNACFSRKQAEALVDVVDFVVGMSREIGDEAARFFAAAFYRGLAFGKSVQTAFDAGIAELQLNGFVDDEAVPALLIRSGADASATVLV